MDLFLCEDGSRRLEMAREFMARFDAGTEVLILASSREAADDFARLSGMPASFGWRNRTLAHLAAEVTLAETALSGRAPAGSLSVHALAARAVHDARAGRRLRYFEPVADRGGFAAAVASTLRDLRGAGVWPGDLRGHGPQADDLAELLTAYEQASERSKTSDRVDLLRTATEIIAREMRPPAGLPLLVLDLALESNAEAELLARLIDRAPLCRVVLPAGDDRFCTLLAAAGIDVEDLQTLPTTSAARRIDNLRIGLFSSEPPAPLAADDSVELFSAPGESRECVEIARRILAEARRGTPFDEMAVVIRAPQLYSGYVDDALRRADIPAYFASGSQRPNRSGRAFLAFLAFAAEDFSALRFNEYLAFGEVPHAMSPRSAAPWLPPAGELVVLPESKEQPAPSVDEEEPPAQPWRWESLIDDCAIFNGAARWRRRLAARVAALTAQQRRITTELGEDPHAQARERDRAQLEHLMRFALPLIEELEALPVQQSWRRWIDSLSALAVRALRKPEGVIAVLAELHPLAEVEGVSLHEVRSVLEERLRDLRIDGPRHRFGRIFVGTPDQVRARSFAVVFVPGLAERIFPQPLREDPLLPDSVRRALAANLTTLHERTRSERLLLRLAVGAARQRVVLSYPRVDVGEARPRVPSFYALEVVRAAEGSLPDVEALEHNAATAGGARLAWPAPADSEAAIDDSEYDLAALEPLLRADALDTAGRARFLIEMNEHLGRSLRSRWRRWESREWAEPDGMMAAGTPALAQLAAHRLHERPYSVSALQSFADCPYRFFLSGILRLEPRIEPSRLERLDPLNRGSFFHAVQAEVVRTLERENLVPLNPQRGARALQILDETLALEEKRRREELAPAVDRVWEDEIEIMRSDLRGWLQREITSTDGWQPRRVEFAFGLRRDEQHDAASVDEPVRLVSGHLLRGAIDLVEIRGTEWRVTDYKTGSKIPQKGAVVDGGRMLQPLMYALALESVLGEGVREGRLYFCTAAGEFAEHVVPLNERTRERAVQVLQTIDRAIETGFLAPLPREGTCARCDFRDACGPYEEQRWLQKKPQAVRDVINLRAMP